jgi:hypothetical protein
VVEPEADLVDVERLGAVDVADRDTDDLELHLHDDSSGAGPVVPADDST